MVSKLSQFCLMHPSAPSLILALALLDIDKSKRSIVYIGSTSQRVSFREVQLAPKGSSASPPSGPVNGETKTKGKGKSKTAEGSGEPESPITREDVHMVDRVTGVTGWTLMEDNWNAKYLGSCRCFFGWLSCSLKVVDLRLRRPTEDWYYFDKSPSLSDCSVNKLPDIRYIYRPRNHPHGHLRENCISTSIITNRSTTAKRIITTKQVVLPELMSF